MTIMAEMAPRVIPADDVRHFSWCDPRLCALVDTGIETTVEHRSVPFRIEQLTGGGVAEMYVSRTRTTWSETDGPRRVVLDIPASTDINELRGLNAWVRDCLDEIERMTVPVPSNVPCPDWCTAETDGDATVRQFHEWTFFRWDGGSYSRTHWGPVGRTYRTQYERSDRDGHLTLGLRRAGRRISRTAVSA